MEKDNDFEGSLTTQYILITEKLKCNEFVCKKIKLKPSVPGRNEQIDYDVIDNFCDALKNNISFNGYIDISQNNLNEIYLFHILCSVHENKNISGLNIKGNKITSMLFNKILLILENNNFKYLNIQDTEISTQEIKNIIFSSLHKKIESLKLPSLNLETFEFMIEYLRDNNSVEKLHFLMFYSNQMNFTLKQYNENINNNFENYIHNLKNLMKKFLNVVEKKENIKSIKFEIDFHDEEIDEMMEFIHSACERHRIGASGGHGLSENKLRINSMEKIQLLMSDIGGMNRHIEKFEKEVSIPFDKDVISFLQKMLP
ncbi:hypothetical protein, conserved [Plasmodium gonderi]|uniref:Leucine-rich repeat protein n=1 Tax=Plasmodium gonderi TaxID=77519 RepID=A0A1Y1JQF4_PLAGO|nr:hypothetical protein, conserved [Plasmodium gonderi]GAW83748.1 hypothetical protein, conserved [Plasmodium gonderi]